LLLAAIMIGIYAQAGGFGYVAYDDDQYVYENHRVKQGLTTANTAWAFTTFFYANWHPLTWISYMLDFSLFGPNAGAQHLVNLVFHLGSAILLFLLLERTTRQIWRSAMVAAIFAVHPLRVESVVWISERKDVLCMFFEMLGLVLYARYAAKANLKRYLPVAIAFALSLLAKPMAVSFPMVLLLVDVWPLQRLNWPFSMAAARPLILEKIPLMGLSAIASVLTFMAQHQFGAVASLTNVSPGARVSNAAIAYVAYMWKFFWPSGLAVLYPPRTPDPGLVAGAVVLLVLLTVVAWKCAEQRPYITVGWFWYVGTLIPVIGIMQVGVQTMADRYTYLPMVGLSIAIVWPLAQLAESRAMQPVLAGAGVVSVIALTVVAYRQTSYWKDSQTLFRHALAVTQNNYILENNLGVITAREGNSQEAISLYRHALSVSPDYAEAEANLGHELFRAGQAEEARSHVEKALRLKPGMPTALRDYGVLLAAQGRFEEARHDLERALAIVPDDADDESNLCYVLTQMRRAAEAIVHCNVALRIHPGHANAELNLKNAQAMQGGGR
jgi:tetratricopeptide (TPR) repeat protein